MFLCLFDFYIMQNNVTKKVTEKSVMHPWNMDTITKSFPQTFVMIGRVVSIVVAPPVDIGASLPNHRNRSGAARSAITSRSMLLTNAIVPNSAPLYWVIMMLESE